jgi:predicted site-specific integrase-resolvase
MTRKILTIAEAAQVLGKSTRTIHLWIQKGELQPISRYIDFDELIRVDKKMNENRGYRGHKNKGGHADE